MSPHTTLLRLVSVISSFSLGLMFFPAAIAAGSSHHGTSHHSQQEPVHTGRHVRSPGSLTASHASTRPRKLALYKVHTLAHFQTVFWSDGHFSPAGMRRLDHFLRDEHNNRERRMDPRLIMLL